MDSDGDGIPDGEEKISQTFIHTVVNQDCAIDEVSVSFAGTGNIKNTTSIKSVMNLDMMSSNVVGLVGEPFEINTLSSFDEATSSFEYKTTYEAWSNQRYLNKYPFTKRCEIVPFGTAIGGLKKNSNGTWQMT